MDTQSDEFRIRLARLESELPLEHPASSRRRRVRLGIPAAAVAVLAVTFAGGAMAREIVQETSWRSSGLFTPGGPLRCSKLRNMSPKEAAPILEALGYHVVWQDEHIPGQEVRQTETPPDGGYLTDGISNGSNLVLMVDAEPYPPSHC